MTPRALASTLAAAAVGIAAIAWAAAGPGFQDVLDTPAAASTLAPKALVNGIALAGDRLVAVGQRGHVLLSDDAGKSWRQGEVPVSSDLVAVAFPAPTMGFAVGHDGVVLRSDDAGATWQRVLDGRGLGAAMVDHYRREADTATDAEAAAALVKEAERFAAQGAENPFLDVGFEDTQRGYLVGAFGLMARTTDGGASWQPWLHLDANPQGLHLYAVRAVSGEVYVVGEQGLVLRLDRAAGRLRALELPYKGTLFGVVGNERAVLVHGLRGTVLRSTDHGRSWTSVATGLQVGLTGSTVAPDGRIVIVSQAGHVLVSADDGASFKLAKTERPLPAAAVAAHGQGGLVVGGPRGLAAFAPQ
jgi:photosystem II stability/assembly factor-like uncharacterized protein